MLNNIGLPGILMIQIVILIAAVFPVICFWKIFKKADFSGYWGLFAMLAVGAIDLRAVLAFAKWPVNQEVSE
ncbi:MAG: hypothetical protein ACRBBK_03715 [Paracoccaceae bacterium]